MVESKTDILRRGLNRRLSRAPLASWMKRVRGRGFYVIWRYDGYPRGVVKGVVGEIVVSPKYIEDEKYIRFDKRFNLSSYRELVEVRLNLYVAPYDVVRHRFMNGSIDNGGFLGQYRVDELFATRADALASFKAEKAREKGTEP